MFETDTGSAKMVETTDCLETVGVFKAAKNFFFIVALLSLLASQVVFWLGDFGLIAWTDADKAVSAVQKDAESQDLDAESAPISDNKKDFKVIEADPADETLIDDARKAVEQVAIESQEADKDTADQAAAVKDGANDQKAAQEAKTDTAKANDAAQEADGKQASEEQVASGKGLKFNWKADWKYLSVVVNVINSVLVFSVVTYLLVLIFSLKVSLIGRLGGMSHISGAFLLSLFACLVILPWQLAFPGIHLYGALYTPAELVTWFSDVCENGLLGKVALYLRFVLSWFIAFVLLIWAQKRSCRWAKATLKRLGIIQ